MKIKSFLIILSIVLVGAFSIQSCKNSNEGSETTKEAVKKAANETKATVKEGEKAVKEAAQENKSEGKCGEGKCGEGKCGGGK